MSQKDFVRALEKIDPGSISGADISEFKMQGGKYTYDYANWDDWHTGEILIKHDGIFAYAFCVYEGFAKRFIG